ncbi:hypothetical protein UlMin_006518 [Ulmus minor]
MASFENLASIDPWSFRASIGDCWISELNARETETITRALQKSLSNTNYQPEILPATTEAAAISQFSDVLKSETVQTPTVSSLSGSDPESSAPRRPRNPIPVASTGVKSSKRKSRASKKSQTTFITADPANFRQMVQQVTGVRFGSAQFPTAPILKPEPQRACSRFPAGAGCLPTLDTSALLLDHHSHQVLGSTSATSGSLLAGSGPLSSFVPPPLAVADGGAGGVGGGLDFDTFPSFPTLESWKVI